MTIEITIEMLSVYLMGGLGNQLFQLFTLISLSMEYQNNFIIPYTEVLTTGIQRPTYWKSFLSNLLSYTTANTENGITNDTIMKYSVYRESGFIYNKIQLPNENANILLCGYFQSYKYFDKHRLLLFYLIGLIEKRNNVKNRFSHILENYHTISMHFRLGDYKFKQEYHPILSIQYYKNALTHLVSIRANSSNINVVYFCEIEDNDTVDIMIKELQTLHLPVNFIKVDDRISDWEQMLLMSCCNDNIIANSSFSWWGGYFNLNESKNICYPEVWFGPANNSNVCDLFPVSWKKIDC